jgi:predicted nuclease of predicted toxin-antitoxin system
MALAQANDCCVIDNDPDFSDILAATRAQGPSIVQIGGQDLAPTVLADTLVGVLRGHADAIAHGAIVALDLRRARVRTLPLP